MKGLYRTIYYFSFPFVMFVNVMLKDEAKIILKKTLIKNCYRRLIIVSFLTFKKQAWLNDIRFDSVALEFF